MMKSGTGTGGAIGATWTDADTPGAASDLRRRAFTERNNMDPTFDSWGCAYFARVPHTRPLVYVLWRAGVCPNCGQALREADWMTCASPRGVYLSLGMIEQRNPPCGVRMALDDGTTACTCCRGTATSVHESILMNPTFLADLMIDLGEHPDGDDWWTPDQGTDDDTN
jgi:hypothetical protein